MGLIYLDANLLIYVVEEVPEFASRVTRRIEAVVRSGNARFAISPLVKMECLVGSVRSGDLALQGYFETFFLRLATLAMPEAVYRNGAILRARFGLRTPDALHLACAQHHGCQALWTNDERLTRAGLGLAKNILSDPA